MKKNKFMRVASVLLVLTLLSTCAISGTFAKYTTSGTADDTARVAKWGIEIATWNTDADAATLFSADYDTTVTASNGTDLLVAPGTDNTNTATFSVKGQAEVDLKLDFVMNVASDVVVPAGEYLDWTTANSTTDKFTVDADYYPVVFTLTQTKTAGTETTTQVAQGNLAAIQTAFNNLTKNVVDANTALDEEWTLTWVWAFDTTDTPAPVVTPNDKADTLLGNNIAGIADDSAAKVSTQLTYDIVITATQIN